MKTLVTRNIGWKMSALALSILFWIILTADPPVETAIQVPIQYRNIPQNLEMNSDTTERVQLEVRGPSAKLTPLSLQDTAVVFDLSSVSKAGERTFPVEEASILLPPGVSVRRAIPNQVRLHFERRILRDVPVSVRISEPPPSGYAVVSRSVNPPTLRVVGPESRISDLRSVETDPIDLSGVVGEVKFSVQAYIGDPRVRFENSGRVTVSIAVRKIEVSEDSDKGE